MLPKVFFLLFVLFLTACSGGDETGPVDIKMDRDICEHCRMVLSDPHFVAEIRYFPPGKRSKIAKFDDIGCAVSWLADKPWNSDKKTEIWVADFRDGKWINARTATYVSTASSPMDYGLGAQSDPADNGLNFSQAKEKIIAVGHRFNEHGLQLQHPPISE